APQGAPCGACIVMRPDRSQTCEIRSGATATRADEASHAQQRHGARGGNLVQSDLEVADGFAAVKGLGGFDRPGTTRPAEGSGLEPEIAGEVAGVRRTSKAPDEAEAARGRDERIRSAEAAIVDHDATGGKTGAGDAQIEVRRPARVNRRLGVGVAD